MHIYIHIYIYKWQCLTIHASKMSTTIPPSVTQIDLSWAWAIHISPRVHMRQPTFLLGDTADMSAVSRSRTCLLRDTVDMPAV